MYVFQTSPAAGVIAGGATTESTAGEGDRDGIPWWVILLMCIGFLLIILLILLLILLICGKRSVLLVCYAMS